MSTRTPILPRPSRLLVSLLFMSLLTLSACAPLPGSSVGLTPNPRSAATTPDPLTGASWVGGAPETPAGAATGLPVGQAFVDLSSNGAAVPRWVLSAGEVEHLKTLLEQLLPGECPSLAAPAGYRGIVVVLGSGDQGVRHAYGGWVWRGSPAAMNRQTTCQIDPGREVERFLLSSAQPYLDPGVFSAIAAELNRPLPIPPVTSSPTSTAVPEARAPASGAPPPATLMDVALGGLVFIRADSALVRRTFSTDEAVVLLPPDAYAAEGDAAYMVPIGWPLRASADARWLLVPTPDQGTWLVSWDGQVQRRINAERLSATWAPDNQRIVFIYQTGAPPRPRDNDVYVQDVVSGGTARLLTRLSQPVAYVFWSPSCPGLGRGGADACAEHVAAVTCVKDAPSVVCTVWLLDAGSAASRALGQFQPAPIGVAPINFGWASSGEAFYVGIAADGPLAFPVDGGRPRPLAGNLPGLAERQPAAYPRLSPDGARLAELRPSAAKEGGQALVILDVRANAVIHQRAPYPDGALIAGWLNDEVALIKYVENGAQILEGVNITSGETQKLGYSDIFVGSWRQLMTRSTEVGAIEGQFVDHPASGFVRDADEGFGVQFARPVDWELCQGTGLSRIYCVAGLPTENPIAPPAFYFTLLPPGFMNEDASAYNWWSPDELAAAFAASIGEQFTSPGVPAGYEKYHTYTRLADVTVDGFSAIVVENERPWGIDSGTKDRRVLIKLGAGALVLGTYYVTEAELHTFEEVVASFRIGTTLRARAAQPGVLP